MQESQPAFTCSKLAMKTIKQGVNLNNLTPCSSISIVNFKHAIARWVNMFKYYDNLFKVNNKDSLLTLIDAVAVFLNEL